MNRIVIVGGGSAGWMAAIALAGRFPEKKITIIDAEAIGAIGVGESVTGVVFQFVTDPYNRLSLGEFFRRCDVTFKTGVWYRDWQGVGTEYLSPIDAPPEHFKYYYASNGEEFYALAAADGVKISDATLYGHLMRGNRTDHFRNPDGSINVDQSRASCHFDALKFARWLREIALTRENIEHHDEVVESFTKDSETGHIATIRTKSGREIAGDFFLDCTGFHRKLLAPAYEPKWLDFSEHVRVDTAIPCFQEFAPGEEIPTYTTAQAMPAGWLWKIPTQERFGRGYLFSSRYLDVAGAIEQMRAVGIEPGDHPRVLQFKPGRFDRLWIGNVCSIGLSGGFIEPLESSTIHGMYTQIRFLTELYLPFLTNDSMPLFARQYNQLMAAAYEDYVDFIGFHYHTGRNDTEFWRDSQKETAITPNNRRRMEQWKHAFPVREDFAGIFTQRAGHVTGLVVWAPMLCGLGYFRRDHARRTVEMSRHGDLLRSNVERYIRFRNQIMSTALTQREAIAHFRAMS